MLFNGFKGLLTTLHAVVIAINITYVVIISHQENMTM